MSDHEAIAVAAGWILDPEYQIWYHPTLSPDYGYIHTDTLCHCEGLIAGTPTPLPDYDWGCRPHQYDDYHGK